MSSFDFDMMLLQRMKAPYRTTVLAALQLDDAASASKAESCIVQLPRDARKTKIGDYIASTGCEPFETGPVEDSPSAFEGSTFYRFILSTWPHLFWRVNAMPDGSTWGPGFESQTAIEAIALHPERVLPGLWTQSVIESKADETIPHDGWDEHQIVRCRFGSAWFEGEFVFSLLQAWSSVEKNSGIF